MTVQPLSHYADVLYIDNLMLEVSLGFLVGLVTVFCGGFPQVDLRTMAMLTVSTARPTMKQQGVERLFSTSVGCCSWYDRCEKVI